MSKLRAGVIGWPISHSLSPRLHGFWLDQFGIDGSYEAFPVEPENLESFLRTMAEKGLRGCNVTIPHKEAAFKICDELDEAARKIGAVNTIIISKEGKLLGSNTDAFGFRRNLEMAKGWPGTRGKEAMILGAGGAARALIHALFQKGFETIHLLNRSVEKAEKIASEMTGDIRPAPLSDFEQLAAQISVLVNATSLGMKGQPSLELDLAPLPDHAVVTDIVYNPLETDLLKAARARNLVAIDGLGMLLHQAIPGFIGWFEPEELPTVTEDLRAHMLEAIS